MLISEIIRSKDPKLITCKYGESIVDAVKKMARGKVGAILVVNDNDEPAGIFTERDLVRLIADKFDEMKNTTIEEIMTRDLVIGFPDDNVDKLKSVMTEKRLRHIPIIDNGRLIGMVSIGDLVKASLDTSVAEIHYLEDYIQGKYA